MTHAWIDASAGVGGDMLLGALLDAGADLAVVQRAVDAVVPGSTRIGVEAVTRAGMRASYTTVAVLVDDPPHRTWRTIRNALAGADLPARVRERATAVFARLAQAEARAHGIEEADVHFHEVGALDSIADVVGTVAALHDLDVDTVSASEVAVGSGSIRVAHGLMAVPGPAVTELGRGWRVRAGGDGELATPTGMALVRTLAATCEAMPALAVERTGTGAGTRDTPGRPNVARVVIGQAAPADAGTRGAEGSPAVVLEANVDDLDPRLWPGVLARLLEAGADDAWLVPILMKKGRPAHTLRVLVDPLRAVDLRRLVLRLTSTIGVRQSDWTKFALPRTWFDVDVAGVPVEVKVAYEAGTIVQVTPEFAAVARAAEALATSEQDVLGRAVRAAAGAGLKAGQPLPPGGRTR